MKAHEIKIGLDLQCRLSLRFQISFWPYIKFSKSLIMCTQSQKQCIIRIKHCITGNGTYLSIYLTPEQQSLVANSLHFSLSIARYQASQRPMPSRSLLSCSAQIVLGRPRGRFQSGPGALPQRAPIAVQSASWAGIPGCMRATWPKRASLKRA